MASLAQLSTNLLRSSPLLVLAWKESPGRPLISGAVELLARMGRATPPSQETGYPLDELLAERGRRVLDELIAESLCTGEPEGIIHAGRFACADVDPEDGWGLAMDQVWLEITIEWRRGEDGEVTCAATAVDVSHTVSIEEERRRHAERLDLIVEGTRLGTWDWDPSTGLITVNRHWVEMLGEPFTSPLVTVDEWEGRIHPEDRERVKAAMEAHIQGQTAYFESTHRLLRADGGWAYVLDRGMVIERDAAGAPTRFSGTHTDITAQKEAELAARDATRAKSLFLATMSHEIRTPLHGILGMLQVLEGTDLNLDQEEATRLAATSGEHLLVLINDILEISKIEAGEFQMDPQPFEIIGWLGSIANLFRSRAEDKGLLFEVMPRLDGPTWISADDHRLQQVVGNLVSNAIKFTHQGQVRIESSLDDIRGVLEVTVTDSGKGIEDTDRIWNSFSQEDASISRSYGGTGLGLSLSRQLVELMGGQIEVESELGKGSTFHFWVPCERVQPPANADDVKSSEEELPLDSLSVLVAEDNPVNRRVASGVFRRFGLDVAFAKDGQEALECCRETRYDVVFMDLHMPRVSGFEAAATILAETEAGEVKGAPRIVALSADLTEEARARCEAIGFHGSLGKPFRIAELEAELRASVRLALGQGLG